MCGRYYIDDETSREIKKILSDLDMKNAGKRYKTGEIFPTDTAPVLITENNGIKPELSAWGFPKFNDNGVIINAKSETIYEKKMFRESLMFRRCIIPANGFFEWNENKEKIYFTQQDSDITYMAGIYNTFKDESRFVIFTTNANQSIVDVHDRMPLILQKDQIHSWLFDCSQTQNLLKQIPVSLKRITEFEQLKLDI